MRGAIFSMPRPVRRVLAVMLALAVFTAFALAIFEEPLVENFGTIQWDAISVHFFNLYFSSDAWHGGALPLWTPYLFGGFPQIADLQVAVFYPINLAIGLFTTFTPDLVLYQVVTHYVLAALFAFLFAYHLSRNLLFSLGGGLAYAFGGFMV
ncbi:MAG: hypothetical protein Q8R13_06030, partial [bacterium]|nr:hypothetical protein [bacterium]